MTEEGADVTYEEDQQQETVGLPALANAGEADPPGTESLFDQLRKKREEADETKETYIAIPGYDAEPPILLAKYRVLTGPEINNIGNKVQRETKDRWDRQFLAAMDTMIAACEGIYYDDHSGDGPQPVTVGDVPIAGYTESLARAMQFDASNARSVVRGLFVENDVAIMQHSARLSLWMGNTTRETDLEILSGGF